MAGGACAAYVFGRTDTAWFENAKYLASDAGVDDAYGTAVATDGASLIVGSPGNTAGAGAAYATPNLFRRLGSVLIGWSPP